MMRVLTRFALGLVVAILFLLLLEGGARLLPLERWEGDAARGPASLFIPGEGEFAVRFVTNPHFQGAMSFQSFARAKPAGVRRIFILGGSAALGWPGPNPSAFSGYLQRAFDQLLPGQVEVINAAAMSYGSHRVLDLVTDIVEMEPDVVIVWSGNNEFVERNALPPAARSRVVGRMQRGLRHSSLYRAVRVGLAAAVPSWFARPAGEDITDLRRTPQVRRGTTARSAAADREIQSNYRANLTAMARLIKESGARGIFCTVPVNLSAWRPADQEPQFRDEEAKLRWREVRKRGEEEWRQGRLTEAADSFAALLAEQPGDALAHFLRGDALRRSGRIDEARSDLQQACELDPRPMRALPSFEIAIHEVAQQQGMLLADLEGAFFRQSGPQLNGLDLFQDYVHPTVEGNRLAAVTILHVLQQSVDPALPFEQLAGLIRVDDWVADNFVWKADAAYVRGMTCQNNADLPCAKAAYLQALQDEPGFPEPAANLGTIYEEEGKLTLAGEFYERALRLDPGSGQGTNLVRVLFRQGERGAARELALRLLPQDPANDRLLLLLGDIETEEKHYPQAVAYYEQALATGETPEKLLRLASVYRSSGDEARARLLTERARMTR